MAPGVFEHQAGAGQDGHSRFVAPTPEGDLVIQSYLKKQEKHRIDNLTLHLKQLEKEEQQKTPKLVEGKKS